MSLTSTLPMEYGADVNVFRVGGRCKPGHLRNYIMYLVGTVAI